MLTFDETYDLAQSINEEAHDFAYDTWMSAEEAEHEGADEEAEELRDQASAEQAEHFRDLYRVLDDNQQAAVQHWLEKNADFRDEFSVWFGEDEFVAEFDQDKNSAKD